MAQNFGDKLIGSIGGVIFGVLIFLASFVVLFNTEGRTDFSTVAGKAVPVNEATADNDFVYATGELKTEGLIGDDYIKQGSYLALRRNVEMYAWKEKVETDDNDVKFYKYETVWTKDPADSAKFHERRGHENYPLELKDETFFAGKAYVGEYEIDPAKAKLPGFETLSLNDEMVFLDDYSSVSDEYYFIGYGSLQDPEVGDIRISYSAVTPGDKATVFGRADGKMIEAHHGENEKGIYRVFWGTNDDAVSKLKEEYNTSGWIWRIVGFVVMWVGLLLIFKPLSVAFEAIPFVSKLGKSAITAITFLAALILTTVTSLLSMVLHNPVGIAAIIVILVGAVYFFMVQKQGGIKALTKEKK